MYRIKVGCHLSYASFTATPAVFIVKPPPHPGLMIAREEFGLNGAAATGEYMDGLGNRCQRVTLAAGPSSLRYEAIALVPAVADAVREGARAIPPQDLPAHLLRYTLPSRYAETDKLLAFAWETFGALPAGWARARGVCDWVHSNVAYKRGVSLPHWSAADTIARRQGVCRDRAHAVVALCRALNMPARYTVCYLPDIEAPDDGIPMDFHAYAEVWLEGGWAVFDPHDAFPRRGRVFIASGLDAADAAFATLYGNAHLVRMQVWADAVDEQERKLDLPRPAGAPPAATPIAAPAIPVSVEPAAAAAT
jgi:transglutaminase-like putative cysteine protease